MVKKKTSKKKIIKKVSEKPKQEYYLPHTDLELVIDCPKGTIFQRDNEYFSVERSILDGCTYLRPLVVYEGY